MLKSSVTGKNRKNKYQQYKQQKQNLYKNKKE